MSTTETPRQRAEALLQIHGGACFVPAKNDLVEPFKAMEGEGLVRIYPALTPEPGINVWKKGYSPKRFRALEVEPLAH